MSLSNKRQDSNPFQCFMVISIFSQGKCGNQWACKGQGQFCCFMGNEDNKERDWEISNGAGRYKFDSRMNTADTNIEIFVKRCGTQCNKHGIVVKLMHFI